MDEILKQFADIVGQVRTHLELQRALGIQAVEAVSPCLSSPVPAVPRTEASIAIPEPSAGRKTAGPGLRGLAAVEQEFSECRKCGLSAGRKKTVFGEGNPAADLMFIGEAPAQEEDPGRPFAGAVGQLLTDIIVKGMQLRPEDVYLCTLVKCATPGHRKPGQDEIRTCENILVRQVEAIRPKIIVALGGTVASALLKTRETITAIRGTWHVYNGIPVMPTFHPAHLLKKESDKRFVWGDIKKIIAEMEKSNR